MWKAYVVYAVGATWILERVSSFSQLIRISSFITLVYQGQKQTFLMARGALILVEGLDRAGKTTQTTRLVEKLETIGPVELIKFPGKSPFLYTIQINADI